MRIAPALPLFLSRVPAGFPSPADDYLEGELDLNELLIQQPRRRSTCAWLATP